MIVTIAIGSLVEHGDLPGRGVQPAPAPGERRPSPEDIQEVSYDHIPMLDRDSRPEAGQTGSWASCRDMVSQFEVRRRLHPDQLPGPARPGAPPALRRHHQVVQQPLPGPARLPHHRHGRPRRRRWCACTEGMKYTTAEPFNRNLYAAPAVSTTPPICSTSPVFEIDEEGTPLLGLPRAGEDHRPLRRHGHPGRGAGERRHRRERSTYEDVPTWVDRVYPADLIMEQYDYHGTVSSTASSTPSSASGT